MPLLLFSGVRSVELTEERVREIVREEVEKERERRRQFTARFNQVVRGESLTDEDATEAV